MTCGRMRRRSFLGGLGLGAAAFTLRPWTAPAVAPGRRVRFGVCADPHKDLIHDADVRLREFVEGATKRGVDFVLQLGDFCTPRPANRGFVDLWESFPGPRYHTLGNHEIDGGFTWEQVMSFWRMERRYYAFEVAGWHFVVLDGNEKKPVDRAPGYPRYIGEEQLAWLAKELDRATGPTLVFSHQSLEDPSGVENGAGVRQVLEEANRRAGWAKVGTCWSGHHHIDHQVAIGGIHYLQVNSMSYSWLGEKYAEIRYGAEIDRRFPYLKYTAPYRDPLYAWVTLEPDGTVQVEGRRSEFVGKSPWDLGMPVERGTSQDPERLAPRISDRRFKVSV